MRGFLFSTDALLAAIILIAGIVLISSITQHTSNTEQISTASEDLLASLASIRISESTAAWVREGIANESIDENATYLEQIGYFWATGRTAEAQQLATEYLDNQHRDLGLRLTIDGTEVYWRNSTKDASNTLLATQMISGIAQGKAITGSSAVAYLRHIRDKRNAAIITFGGFVGEGNITYNISSIPAGANVTGFSLELDTDQAFDLYVNGNQCDRLTPTPTPLTPSAWDRSNCSGFIVPGSANTIEFKYNGSLNGSSIAGGTLKLTYTTDELSEATTSNTIYSFPQIDGLINLYDGFYIDGNLSSMNITLHFLSNYTTYLTIANASTSFAGSGSGQVIFINESQVASMIADAGLSLDNLSQKTIPLRFGIGNVLINGAAADIAVVTDTSGSMSWCATTDWFPPCPAGDTTKISTALNVTRSFINQTLNGTSGTRVGLSEFADDIKSWHNLTSNLTPLTSQVNAYAAGGGTCICCGMNNATAILTGEGQIVLVQRSSSGWRYNDSNVATGPSGWNTTSFNNALWKSGSTNIGWGYSGQSTTITNRYQGPYYHRKLFNISNASEIKSAMLYVFSDDGADVYINGVRVDDNYGDTVGTGSYWDRDGVHINKSLLVTGTNVVAVRQYHRTNPNRMGFDLEIVANTLGNVTSTQRKNIVLMTDGQATNECAEQGTGDASDDAIQAACDAYTNYGIIVYTVGFGLSADTTTLQAMADCTTGQYFAAANSSSLSTAFSTIADTIIQSSTTQTAILSGNVSRTVLYSDSSIKANFSPAVTPPTQNEISITMQSSPLPGCVANVTLQPGMRFIDASLTSYSSDQWTDLVTVSGTPIYNLSTYASTYASLGDPFSIRVPPALLSSGNNSVHIQLGIDSYNSSTNCSANNTLIYTAAVNLSTERSSVVEGATGCNWQVQFVDGTSKNLTIPTSYAGTTSCSYRPGNITYNATDAYQLGAYVLFNRLDFSNEGALFVNLDAEDLEVIVTTIGGVPYMWGPAIVKLEVTR